VGEAADEDQMYRLTFDGSVADEHGYVAMGGQADQIATALGERYDDGLDSEAAVSLAAAVLAEYGAPEARRLDAGQLEVAVLDRTRAGSRKFRRLPGERLRAILGDGSGNGPSTNGAATDTDAAATDEGDEGDEGGPVLTQP
jgi:proteasome alpha subunit